jgi:hypothetical protein
MPASRGSGRIGEAPCPQYFLSAKGISERRDRQQVNPSTEHSSQFLPQIDELESGRCTWLELHKYVDAAVRSKVGPQDGAEKPELRDTVSPTEFRKLLLVNVNFDSIEHVHIQPRLL